MLLHNLEYHAMCDLRKTIRNAVEEILMSSEVYQRVKDYIEIARDNSELLAKHIRENNSLCYDGITQVHVGFDTESLNIYILTYRGKSFHKRVNIDVDTLIILLAECGLIEDKEVD